MRTYLALGFLVLAGFALVAAHVNAATTPTEGPAAADNTPVAVQQVRLTMPGLRDEAAMVLVGTALIGLAAAVKRAA
ncbi:MAG: hypothetical protein ABIQ52_11875 [Vicinamibacterales bacterium]